MFLDYGDFIFLATLVNVQAMFCSQWHTQDFIQAGVLLKYRSETETATGTKSGTLTITGTKLGLKLGH